MKIEDIIAQQTQNELTPLQKKVLDFFKSHKGEAFVYDDPQIYRELSDEKPAAIDWSIWALEEKKLLEKQKVGKRTYHGLPEDIKNLRNAVKKQG